MKNAHGFTLIEILVSVVIITIIASIGTLSYAGFQAQSRDDKRQANAAVIAESLERYYDKNGEYPSVTDVTNTNGLQVKSLLDIADTSALVMPNAPANTTNSLKAPTEALSPSIIAYEATVANASDSEALASCTEQTGGGCDSFTLKWKTEGDTNGQIDSRRSSRLIPLQAPLQNPIMTASLVSGSVVGTISHASPSDPVCPTGTAEYKIISSTSDITPNWSTVNWQTTKTKTVTSPVPSTEYFFYAIARCVSQDGNDAENTNVAKDSFFYTSATMEATWSGTTAVGTLKSASPTGPICQSTQTARYFIQSKIDTVSAEGTWLPASPSWTTTNYIQVTDNGTNPRKISFRGQARCDTTSPAETGTPFPIPYSNTDSLISAPARPALSAPALSGSTLSWNWGAVACPKSTPSITTRYNGVYLGDFINKPGITSISSPLSLTGVYKDGFSRGLRITASCGAVTNKVLQSAPNDQYHSVQWPTNLGPGRGKLYTEYSSGNYAQGRTRLQSASTTGACEGVTYRSLHVQFGRNKAGDDADGWWGYNTVTSWTGGDIVVAGPDNLISTVKGAGGDNTTLETRADVYCYNPYNGQRSPTRLFDRYGILRIMGNSDSNPKPSRYYITCTGQSLNGNGDPNLAHCRGGVGAPSSLGLGSANYETLNGQGNAWQTDW